MLKPLTQRMIDTTPPPATGFKELRERGLVRAHLCRQSRKSWSVSKICLAAHRQKRAYFRSLRRTAFADSSRPGRPPLSRLCWKRGKRPEPGTKRHACIRDASSRPSMMSAADASTHLRTADFRRAGDKAASRRDRMARLRRAVEPFKEPPRRPL